MIDISTGKIVPDDKVFLCDGIITLIYEDMVYSRMHIERIVISGEYDQPMTLAFIEKKWPGIIYVLFSEALGGDIYKSASVSEIERGEEHFKRIGELYGFA